MSQRRFIERLKDPNPYLSESSEAFRQRLEESIRDHLTKLLNTRQGWAAIRSDYGMFDLTQLSRDDSNAPIRVRDAIQEAIEKFEPRLKVLRIEPMPSDNSLRLQFHIEAELVMDDRRHPVFYHTNITQSGNVNLRRIDALSRSSPGL